MALDKLVDSTLLDASLAYEAGKLRAKLGSSAQLDFDLANEKGFGDYIDAIPSGGGEDEIVALCNNTLTSYSSTNILDVRVQLFLNCTHLTSISLPNAWRIQGNGLRNTGLTVFVGPKVTSVEDSGLSYNAQLTTVDILGRATKSLYNGALRNNSHLSVVILRFNGVANNGGTSVFTSTPFAQNGTGGTLYVPQAQIDNYKAATNWSTILSYANNQILPIEGSIYETQHADGTPVA